MSRRQEIAVAEKNLLKAQRALALLKELAKLEDGEVSVSVMPKKKKKAKAKASADTEVAPAKRRGRPPKEKSESDAPKRGRGRPKKVVAPVVTPSEGDTQESETEKKASLGELCLEIAREASEPKPIAHFIEELHKKNYVSKAKDFKNIVYQGLNGLKNDGKLNKNEELEYFLVDAK